MVFDAVGKGSFAQFEGVLNPGGLYITTVPSLGTSFGMTRTRLFGDKQAVFAATGMKPVGVRKQYLADLRERLDSEAIRAVIGRRYPLGEIGEAHRYVDTGHKRGTAVVVID